MAALVVARKYGIVADEPLWAYALAIGGSSLLSKRLDRWIDAPRGSWRLHVRVFVHALTVMTVIYLTGWGPALGVCFVYAALVDLQQSGPGVVARGARLVVGVLRGRPVPRVPGVGAVVPEPARRRRRSGSSARSRSAIVIVMAGAIGEGKAARRGVCSRARARTRCAVKRCTARSSRTRPKASSRSAPTAWCCRSTRPPRRSSAGPRRRSSGSRARSRSPRICATLLDRVPRDRARRTATRTRCTERGRSPACAATARTSRWSCRRARSSSTGSRR